MRLNHHGNFHVQRFQLFEQIKKDDCAPPSPTQQQIAIHYKSLSVGFLWSGLRSDTIPPINRYIQGRINHWANRANARGLALLGASRLDIKRRLHWFFMSLGCSPRVKIVELFDYCV